MGPLTPADTAVLGIDILLRVVEWLYDNRDLPCTAISSTEFTTPLAVLEEREETIPLSVLHREPARVLDYPYLFLSGWAGV